MNQERPEKKHGDGMGVKVNLQIDFSPAPEKKNRTRRWFSYEIILHVHGVNLLLSFVLSII